MKAAISAAVLVFGLAAAARADVYLPDAVIQGFGSDSGGMMKGYTSYPAVPLAAGETYHLRITAPAGETIQCTPYDQSLSALIHTNFVVAISGSNVAWDSTPGANGMSAVLLNFHGTTGLFDSLRSQASVNGSVFDWGALNNVFSGYGAPCTFDGAEITFTVPSSAGPDVVLLYPDMHSWPDTWNPPEGMSFELVPVPEPTSLALLAIGAAGLLACRRRG